MNEILRLADGSEFSLVTNGIKTNANTLVIEVVKPDGMTLEEVRAAFSNKAATAEIKVVKDGTTIRIDAGYTCLGSRIILDDNTAIGVKVTETTLEDGTVSSETETVYAAVVRMELQKETLEDKVEANRADIDYLLMMEE